MNKNPLLFCILISILCTAIVLGAICDDAAAATQLSNAAQNDSYKISAGDLLNIQVYEETDLTGEFEVKDDGTITYPLLGAVKVAGLTKSEIEKLLTQSLGADYLVDPYLHVTIRTYHERNILVLGCVQKPGSYAFSPDNRLTLMQAISLAGGFTGYAAPNSTKIIRTNADGKKIAVDPKVNEILSGRKKDVELLPNDLVMVPERIF